VKKGKIRYSSEKTTPRSRWGGGESKEKRRKIFRLRGDTPRASGQTMGTRKGKKRIFQRSEDLANENSNGT